MGRTLRLTSLFSCLFVALSALACATPRGEEGGSLDSSGEKAVTTAAAGRAAIDEFGAAESDSAALGAEAAEADAEPTVSPEDFEEGFCVDDVYAQYLMARYHREGARGRVATLPMGSTTSSRRHGRRHRATAYERAGGNFQALAYAHAVMNGQTSPYFGELPIVVNEQVNFWLQYFKTSGRKMFLSWLVRGESMRPLVEPVLRENGIPNEFFYLAMIESGLSNSASSRARATGTWQFMQGTAQLYGLKINHWVDERRDPVKSTMAAAAYLKDLYADVGDWYLAMASYNAGPGKIHRALKQAGGGDFWTLTHSRYLANETKQYVPKMLAAVLLAADAKAHGFDIQADSSEPVADANIVVTRPVRLNEVAAGLGVPARTVQSWNPELTRGITPPSRDGYRLKLPVAYAQKFAAIASQLSVLDVKDVQLHKVRRGDNLSKIARHYHVSVKAILSMNPDLKAVRLRPGSTVAVPVPVVSTTSRDRASHEEVL